MKMIMHERDGEAGVGGDGTNGGIMMRRGGLIVQRMLNSAMGR